LVTPCARERWRTNETQVIKPLKESGDVRRNHRFGLRRAHSGRLIHRRSRGEFAGFPVNPPAPDEREEFNILRQRTGDIRRRLEEIKRRIGGQETLSSQEVTAIVDEEECMGCALCLDVCPTGAISMNGSAVIDPAKCTACLACVRQCPQGAIAVKYPDA
jgi:ferredoxin